MKRALLLLLFAAMPAAAALGVLVSFSTKIVGGKTYWSCVYDVTGTMVERLIPFDSGPCPSTIQM